MKCDFCDDPKPTWEYPCRSFGMATKPGGTPIAESIGEWMACKECHDLIETGDEKGLAQRAADKLGHPFKTVMSLHNLFRQHRLGAAAFCGTICKP